MERPRTHTPEQKKRYAANRKERSPEITARQNRNNYLHRKADPESHQKLKARSLTRARIRSGLLARQPCEVCGAGTVEAHHDDYSRPDDVRWLCPDHHREHHRAQQAA